MEDRWRQVIITASAWVAVVVVLRVALSRAYDTWERHQVEVDEATRARRRTTFSVLRRVFVALVAVIGTWSVLSIFPQTGRIADALLASSAVLAVFAGLALNTPLGNLGSGVLIAFTQPVRLGDRVTVGDQTGFVEQINLIYTALVTDDDRRVFVPNTQLTTAAVVNRTIRDPRRTVTASLPVPLGSSVPDARALLLEAARSAPEIDDARVDVGEVSERLVWLTVTAYAPLQSDVGAVASGVRERGLAALGSAGLLPSAT